MKIKGAWGSFRSTDAHGRTTSGEGGFVGADGIGWYHIAMFGGASILGVVAVCVFLPPAAPAVITAAKLAGGKALAGTAAKAAAAALV